MAQISSCWGIVLDTVSDLKNANGKQPKAAADLEALMTDDRATRVRAELAACRVYLKPLVEATYFMEGDGFLGPSFVPTIRRAHEALVAATRDPLAPARADGIVGADGAEDWERRLTESFVPVENYVATRFVRTDAVPLVKFQGNAKASLNAQVTLYTNLEIFRPDLVAGLGEFPSATVTFLLAHRVFADVGRSLLRDHQRREVWDTAQLRVSLNLRNEWPSYHQLMSRAVAEGIWPAGQPAAQSLGSFLGGAKSRQLRRDPDLARVGRPRNARAHVVGVSSGPSRC